MDLPPARKGALSAGPALVFECPPRAPMPELIKGGEPDRFTATCFVPIQEVWIALRRIPRLHRVLSGRSRSENCRRAGLADVYVNGCLIARRKANRLPRQARDVSVGRFLTHNRVHLLGCAGPLYKGCV